MQQQDVKKDISQSRYMKSWKVNMTKEKIKDRLIYFLSFHFQHNMKLNLNLPNWKKHLGTIANNFLESALL